MEEFGNSKKIQAFRLSEADEQRTTGSKVSDFAMVRGEISCRRYRNVTESGETGLLLLAGGLEAVPHPGFGDDVMRCALGVYLFAKLRHQHSQMFRLLHTVGAPDGEKQGSMGHHPAGVSRQVEQQFEFLGSKPDLIVLQGHSEGIGVDREVSDCDGSL